VKPGLMKANYLAQLLVVLTKEAGIRGRSCRKFSGIDVSNR